MRIGILGFGEAGPVFAKALADRGATVTAYDLLQDDPDSVEAQLEKTRGAGATPVADATALAAGADLIVSTVTAGEATRAAASLLPGLCRGKTVLDLNSVAPATKAAIARTVATSGAAFVEAVAMDTVPLKGAEVPILACGAEASLWADRLRGLGLSVRSVGAEYGRASSTKLVRSVVVKGLEALFAEAMEAAGDEDLAEAVLASVSETFPGLDWRAMVGYHLQRSALHGARRAAEMRECASFLRERGVAPIMTEAIARRQDDVAARFDGAQMSTPSVSAYLAGLTGRESC